MQESRNSIDYSLEMRNSTYDKPLDAFVVRSCTYMYVKKLYIWYL